MKPNSHKPDLAVQFLLVFALDAETVAFPEFKYWKKGATEPEVLRYLKASKLEGVEASCLHMLHPQARKFITEYVKNYRLEEPLATELQKAIWQGQAQGWVGQCELGEVLESKDDERWFKFRIANIGAVLSPTGILILHVDIAPAFELPSEAIAMQAAKMLLLSFVKTGSSFVDGNYQGKSIKRLFTRQEQQESVARRFGENNADLLRGLMGAEVTLTDVIKSLLPDKCFEGDSERRSCSRVFLMGDRFHTNTFLKTDWDGQSKAFSDQDHFDLVRLARGEDDKYKPVQDRSYAGNATVIRTFENVAFGLCSEGIACWVRPTKDQQFLHEQFRRDRYDTVYFHLYLLALHQRYALVNLENRLDDATPPREDLEHLHHSLPECRPEALENCARRLAILRAEVSDFYLRGFFQQPASLTNHQEFYRALQQVLGVSELLDKVRQSTSELEYLIESFLERITAKRYQENTISQATQHTSRLQQIAKLIVEQEKSAKSHLALTMVVELVAIPYYTFSFLSHATHLPDFPNLVISLLLTLAIMATTIFVMKRSGKKQEPQVKQGEIESGEV